MTAWKHGYPEIVKLLIDNEWDFTKCDRIGQSALIIACERGYISITAMIHQYFSQKIVWNKVQTIFQML